MTTALDFDRWGYGRNPQGKLDLRYLKASYQYIEFNPTEEWDKIRRILEENIEDDQYGLRPYITMSKYIFFHSREERNLVQTLRMIY